MLFYSYQLNYIGQGAIRKLAILDIAVIFRPCKICPRVFINLEFIFIKSLSIY